MMNRIAQDIDVFILCGGFGKRLKKISRGVPKPMVKIGKFPFLDLIINYMVGFGFRRFLLGVGYNADFIKDYYSNREYPVKILFSKEKKPLDTGGAVKNAKKLIKSNPFFVLNGDSFVKFDPIEFLNFHRNKKSLISILLKKHTNAEEFGEVKINAQGRILDFNEKNKYPRKAYINTGVYLFGQKAFGLMPLKTTFSLERDFFPALCGCDIFGCIHKGFFIDIGTPERYFMAKDYFLNNDAVFRRSAV